MNIRADQFKALLIEMFGEKTTNRMLNSDLSLNNKGISASTQQEIQEQLLILENKFSENILNIQKEWIFDFPGWFGKLKLNDNDLPGKPIMVVGEDPNLPINSRYGHYELYAAYAACDPCDVENQKIWSIVPYITGFTQNISDISNRNIIYATDRCYIAPKHVSVAEKTKLVKWGDISGKIGRYFINKQLDILRPSITISNGIVAYNMLTGSNIYTEIDNNKILFSVGNKPRYIKTAINNENGTILISIPHLGRRHHKFWNDTAIIQKAKKIIISIQAR